MKKLDPLGEMEGNFYPRFPALLLQPTYENNATEF